MTPSEGREREVIEAAVEAFEKAPPYREDGPDTTDHAAMEAAIDAADEKRRALAQVDPGGQEYAYRVCWDGHEGAIRTGLHGSLAAAEEEKRRFVTVDAWVERALLGTWEKIA